VSLAAITLCVASQRVLIVVYFVIDSVRKLLDTLSYFYYIRMKKELLHRGIHILSVALLCILSVLFLHLSHYVALTLNDDRPTLEIANPFAGKFDTHRPAYLVVLCDLPRHPEINYLYTQSTLFCITLHCSENYKL
jgi:hypothetical protein